MKIDYNVTGIKGVINIEIYVKNADENIEYFRMFNANIFNKNFDKDIILDTPELLDFKDIFDDFYATQHGDDCYITFKINMNRLVLDKEKEEVYNFISDKLSQYEDQDKFWNDVAKKIALSVQNIIENRIGKLLHIIVRSKISGAVREFSQEFVDKYGEKMAIYKMINEKKK